MDKCHAFILNFEVALYISIIFIFWSPYSHYLSLAALTAASLLSRHFVLTESQDLDKDTTSSKSSSASASPPATQLHSIINFSPEYALKFAREFR